MQRPECLFGWCPLTVPSHNFFCHDDIDAVVPMSVDYLADALAKP